jgi:hypothetical protein
MVGATPVAFKTYIKQESDKYSRLISGANNELEN